MPRIGYVEDGEAFGPSSAANIAAGANCKGWLVTVVLEPLHLLQRAVLLATPVDAGLSVQDAHAESLGGDMQIARERNQFSNRDRSWTLGLPFSTAASSR